MEVFEGIHQCLPTCNNYNAWLDTLDRLLHHSISHWTDPPPHKKQKTKKKYWGTMIFSFSISLSLCIYICDLTLNFTCKNAVPGVAVCFGTDRCVCWMMYTLAWCKLGKRYNGNGSTIYVQYLGFTRNEITGRGFQWFFFLYLPLPINLNFE